MHRFLCAALALLVGCAEGQVSTPGGGGNGGDDPSGGNPTTGGGGQGGQPNLPCGIDCSTINAPPCLQSVCNEGQYMGPVFSCVVVEQEAGAPCEDGQFCTTADSCDGMGNCVGGPANDCGMEPPQCQVVSCDEDADSCTLGAGQNGTFCTPTDLCLVNATCVNGSCSGGTPKDCFFAPVPNECWVAVCNPQNGQCEPEPDTNALGAPCVDASDPCVVNHACDGMGNCIGGEPKDCSAFTMGCTVGTCDPLNGNCFGQAGNNGDPCDDLDACTSGETCSNAVCGGGMPVSQCIANDGCCPQGCTDITDADCACAGWLFQGSCWYTGLEGQTCTQVCANHCGFDQAGTQHTGNAIGFHFWPQKANGSDWESIECSSTDNNTNWGANGAVPSPVFSHPACHLNCACNC
jgi:hypothetical protein